MSQWYVLRLLSKQELSAERVIQSLGLGCMVPYREASTRIRAGRYRKRRYALFPGYAFVSLGNVADGWQAIQGALNSEDRRVAFGLLPTSDNPETLSPKDVLYLASIADGKYQDGDDLPRLRVGDEVLVAEGPIKGFTGRILRIIRGKKATVAIKQVKIAREIEIALANLDRV